jgi:hypothetical protein
MRKEQKEKRNTEILSDISKTDSWVECYGTRQRDRKNKEGMPFYHENSYSYFHKLCQNSVIDKNTWKKLKHQNQNSYV